MSTTTLPELQAGIRDQIEEHVFSETEREVGGVLVGHLEGGVATIEAAIPALRAAEGAMNVTFTHDVWSDVLDEVERNHPDRRIVGWYHSHPGFGLFLSEYDSFIQSNFFSEPGMLALVVDPLAGEAGWFTWADAAIQELGTSPTARPAAARRTDARLEARTRRRGSVRAVAGGIVLAGLAAAGGYAFGSLSAPVVTVAGPEQAEAGRGGDPAATGSAEGGTSELQAQLESAQARIAELEGAKTATISYTVRRGESWWSISEALTGDGFAYEKLREANPEQPALDPGDVIIVPNVPVAAAP